jgi:hypothetical protein
MLQCSEQKCHQYEVNGLCTSVCDDCGVLCESFPITDLTSLQLYKSKGCTIIDGDLHISGLAVTVTKKVLFDNLKGVRSIRGVLYFHDNIYMSAMTFFSELVEVHGISYRNNPILVDARMPSLAELRGDVVVEGCDRLCPARYTVVGASPDDSGCTNPLMEYSFRVVGDAQREDLEVLANLTARVGQHVTDNEVRLSMWLCEIF